MPDTTNRPTIEEIVADELCAEVEYGTIDRHAAGIVKHLAEHGYVIAHPDDVPERPVHSDDFEFSSDFFDAGDNGDRLRNEGWNDCRAHIFKGNDQ